MDNRKYCEVCMKLVDTDKCEDCGNKHLREVEAHDFVLLTELDSLFAGVLEDVLKQHSIKYITKSKMGAGLTALVGNALDKISFYVPMELFDEASNIVDELFGGSYEEELSEELSNEEE